MKTDHAILGLCQLLEVSPSGFYDWQQRRDHPGPRAQANQTLTGQIATIFASSRQTYGSPRVQQALGQRRRQRFAAAQRFRAASANDGSPRHLRACHLR